MRTHQRDVRYEKEIKDEQYDKKDSGSIYDNDLSRRHHNISREKDRYQEKERRMQKKSTEILEDKRKSRPLSPPKEVYHRDRRRYENEDTQSWRSSNYFSESSSQSYNHRVAPPLHDEWDRRPNNGYENEAGSRSPGYIDHR